MSYLFAKKKKKIPFFLTSVIGEVMLSLVTFNHTCKLGRVIAPSDSSAQKRGAEAQLR